MLGGHRSVTLAPVVPDAERWLVGAATPLFGCAPVADRIFEMHTRAHCLEKRPEVWAWYGTQDRPVYTLDVESEIPTHRVYPLADVQATFTLEGDAPESCFGGSLDYMIPLALIEDTTEIVLSGFLMREAVEYTRQRPSAFYWIAFARAMGCRVITERASGLGTVPRVYGYGTLTGAPSEPGDPKIVVGRPGVEDV